MFLCVLSKHTEVWLHSDSPNAVFQHLNGCFVRSKVIFHQQESLVESGPEEPKAECRMWVKFSRVASFNRSQEFQKKGLWLHYSFCLILHGETYNSRSRELEKNIRCLLWFWNISTIKMAFLWRKWCFTEDIVPYAVGLRGRYYWLCTGTSLYTDGLEMKWQGHLCLPQARL